MAGWIKIHRTINKHWIFTDAERFRAWMIILLTVNFEPKKQMIEGELISCDRGQSIISLNTWASKFGNKWTVQKVRTFFNLLKKDEMIHTEGLRKTTRLTVCNYDSYQDEQQADNKQITQRQHRDNKQITTTKEGKEREEGKEGKETKGDKPQFSFKQSLLDLEIEEEIVSDWLKVRAKKKAANTKTAFTALIKQFELSGLSANDCIKQSVENSWSGFKADWLNNNFGKPKVVDMKIQDHYEDWKK